MLVEVVVGGGGSPRVVLVSRGWVRKRMSISADVDSSVGEGEVRGGGVSLQAVEEEVGRSGYSAPCSVGCTVDELEGWWVTVTVDQLLVIGVTVVELESRKMLFCRSSRRAVQLRTTP